MTIEKPRISILMPSYNEENGMRAALDSLTDPFVLKNAEIIIIDGMSTDRTRGVIREFADENRGLPVRTLDNRQRLQSYGLNIGLAEAAGEIIVRADAHCLYPPKYVKRCVALLESKSVANAGGVQLPAGTETVQSAIAAAMRHPVGSGEAKFRTRNYAGYAEGAFVGTFRKKLFDEIGTYDSGAHPNEDGELNLRILKSGRKIYVDGSIEVTYFPRRMLGALARQYFYYGRGRAYTTWKHKKLTGLRQIAPPVLVASLAGSLLAGVVWPFALLLPAAYAGSLFGVSLLAKLPDFCYRTGKPEAFKIRLLMPAAWAAMHLSWGAGFLVRFIRLLTVRRDDWAKNSTLS